MQETVTGSNERKSLFSSFLEVLETREKQAELDRQLQEEKYLRRTQRIYDLHERQRRSAVELRRCLDYVSQHAHVLEAALRGGGGGGSADPSVPLAAALLRHAAPLQRRMSQCVANAARIRCLLTAAHQPQMDALLAKMEAELGAWTQFLQRAVDATYHSEIVVDNLHNMIAEQRRYVREVSSSSVFSNLTGGGGEEGAEGEHTERETGGRGDPQEDLLSPPTDRRAPSAVCSTPIDRE